MGTLSLIVLTAWASALACAALAGWHVKKLERLSCPGAKALVERARAAAKEAPVEQRRAAERAELADVRAEASRALALATLVPRGMARIALASGTALGVLVLARQAGGAGLPPVAGAVLAFAGGVAGSALSAAFGRRARERAAVFRARWKAEMARAEAELSSAES